MDKVRTFVFTLLFSVKLYILAKRSKQAVKDIQFGNTEMKLPPSAEDKILHREGRKEQELEMSSGRSQNTRPMYKIHLYFYMLAMTENPDLKLRKQSHL